MRERMMDQRCRQVPETCEVSQVDVAILDERVFHVPSHQDGHDGYHHSTIAILDDPEEHHPRIVVRDMHGAETCACSLGRDSSRVRFLLGFGILWQYILVISCFHCENRRDEEGVARDLCCLYTMPPFDSLLIPSNQKID